MKNRRVVVMVAVVAMMIAVPILGGCTPGVTGVIINPSPVPPSTWISAADAWSTLDGLITDTKTQKAVIALEQSGYNSVPREEIQNALAQLSLDHRWGELTAVEAFIVQVRRADPQAAVGLGLLGPPEKSIYWAVTLDVDQYGIISVWLISPLSGEIIPWDRSTTVGGVYL